MSIQSKCGKVKVQLDLDGSTVSMQVLAMPEELRGKHLSDYPMHAAHGLSLLSLAEPELRYNAVCLWGEHRPGDDNTCSLRLRRPHAATYYDCVKALIEGFDSTGLLKKQDVGNSKEWRIIGIDIPILDRKMCNLYRKFPDGADGAWCRAVCATLKK